MIDCVCSEGNVYIVVCRPLSGGVCVIVYVHKASCLCWSVDVLQVVSVPGSPLRPGCFSHGRRGVWSSGDDLVVFHASPLGHPV